MNDFIYNSNVRIFYGAGQMENVVQEISKLGKMIEDSIAGNLD